MRCLKCEYPLWDLQPGACPECGEPFDPTGHRFKTGGIRFCCPHCDQAYYGDDEDGHLRPRTFDCVGCGRVIDESECVVRPREDGSHEDQTVPDISPWHDEDRTWWRRFWGTVGMSMVRPMALGRGLPRDAVLKSGIGFFLLVYSMTLVLGVLPFFGIFGLMPLLATPGGGMAGGPGLAVMSGGVLVMITVSILMVFIFGTIIHGVLRISGPTTGGLGRTLACVCFGSAPFVVAALPCIGYCLQTPLSIWVIVSSILILTQAQAVSGLRASLAVLTPILLAVGAYIVVIVLLLMSAGNLAGGGAAFGVVQPPIVLDTGEVLQIDDSRFLAAVLDASELPTVGEIGGLDGVKVRVASFGVDVAVTTYEGRGFKAWSVPGLFLIKTDAGAGLARFDWFNDRFRFAGLDSNGSSMGITAAPTGLYAEVVDKITDLGGVGDDLDRTDFEAWITASTAPSDANTSIEATVDFIGQDPKTLSQPMVKLLESKGVPVDITVEPTVVRGDGVRGVWYPGILVAHFGQETVRVVRVEPGCCGNPDAGDGLARVVVFRSGGLAKEIPDPLHSVMTGAVETEIEAVLDVAGHGDEGLGQDQLRAWLDATRKLAKRPKS